MHGKYLGRLSPQDRLFDYLKSEIFMPLGCDCRDGIRVFETNGSNAVYVYEERVTNVKVVGKFFYSERKPDWECARRRMNREWDNIHAVRSLLDGVHYVARALGRNESLNCLLIVEYCYGMPLEEAISRAVSNGEEQLLLDKLRALAAFLAKLHNRSSGPGRVDFNIERSYFETILATLSPQLHHGERDFLRSLAGSWFASPEMWEDREVLVHGDATPANFFFGDGMYVISFDMERVRRSDRAFDLGRLAGELQHYYLRATGNKFLAEPFIGHLLREYSGYFPDADRAYASIIRRIPFYMGLTLLRIARNTYLHPDYRRALIGEAKLCWRRRN